MKKIKFKWAAQDENGRVDVYSVKPDTGCALWSSLGHARQVDCILDLSAVDFGDDWKQSLRRIKVKKGKLLLREKRAKVVEVGIGDVINPPSVGPGKYLTTRLDWADGSVVAARFEQVQP